MPHRLYLHDCCGEVKKSAEARCGVCGRPQTPVTGWQLSVTEKMCQYAEVTGLTPFGPHRHHDQPVWRCLRKCSACDSTGLSYALSQSPADCHNCEHCLGTGYRLVKSRQKLADAINILTRQFPDARAGRPSVFLRSTIP